MEDKQIAEMLQPEKFNDGHVLEDLERTLEHMRNYKPKERSEKSRRYAVTITEMEKVIAYFKVMIVDSGD